MANPSEWIAPKRLLCSGLFLTIRLKLPILQYPSIRTVDRSLHSESYMADKKSPTRQILGEEETVERRFIVHDCDPKYLKWESSHVTTGFLETASAKSLRVRIVDNADHTQDVYMTVTHGRGAKRRKINEDISLKAAKMFLAACSARVTFKTRYSKDNWRLDVFERELNGFLVIEVKGIDLNMPITRPSWVHSWEEVTGKVTNYSLAMLASLRSGRTDSAATKNIAHEDIARAVVTGGPGSGKTSVIKQLHERFGDRMHFVPEVATIIIGQLGMTPPQNDPIGMMQFQQTVAQTQRVFEDGAVRHAYRIGKVALLQDRGEVDGGAYMEGGLRDLELVTGLSLEHLYERYDLVICLDVPPKDIYDVIKDNDAERSEDYAEAVELGGAIKKVWGNHHNFHLVGNHTSWNDKLAEVSDLIDKFLKTL